MTEGPAVKAILARTIADYGTLCLILGAITVAEWGLYLGRHVCGFAASILVPALLAMSAVKFGLVMGWYMQLEGDPGWRRKGLAAGFVVGGGTVLSLALLLGR